MPSHGRALDPSTGNPLGAPGKRLVDREGTERDSGRMIIQFRDANRSRKRKRTREDGMLLARVTGVMTHCCPVYGLALHIFLAAAFWADAATVCVGPSATGSGSGTDWNNLMAWSATPARGDTWYLVDGSYAAKTFATAVSGSTLITIKKATISDHGGISTGWSDTLGDGQAIFSVPITFRSSYWVFDGTRGVDYSSTGTDYGFAFVTSAGDDIKFTDSASYTASYITVSRVYAPAPSNDSEKWFCLSRGGVAANITISHSFFRYWGCVLLWNYNNEHNWIVEYNLILDAFASSANHAESIDGNGDGTGRIIRYNIFRGSDPASGAGATGTIVANNDNLTGVEIYGNVFHNVRVANGIITGTSIGRLSNCKIYNNTFITANSNSAGNWVAGGQSGGSGNIANNNLLYNMRTGVDAGTGSGVTSDYNEYIYSLNAPSESHGHNISANYDPFVSLATYDYRLKTNTVAGVNLGLPYNVDPHGNVRTTWTRGAFEFGGAGTNAAIVVSPSVLGFGSVAVGTSSNLTATVKNVGGGTLTGTAAVAAPFSIVGGGTYNLGTSQTQTVTIAFSPTTAGTFAQAVTFSGGAGASINVSGLGVAAGSNSPPIVSAIAQNATDVDPVTPGLQVYAGTVVQYSGSASDANGDLLSWQWIYSVNGGAEVVYQSGSGAVTPISYTYGAGTAGSTYLWKLRVSDGTATSESSLAIGVEALAASGGGLTFQAGDGAITAPFVLTNGAIYQAVTSGVTDGGRAAYNFSITNSGSYVIRALVNAPDLTANSFYLNIDAEPQDPAMAWDINPVTAGFEERLVSWRGDGTSEADQFVPQVFRLGAGTHQLIIRGREANAVLQSLTLLQLPSPPQSMRIVAIVQ